MTLRCQQHYLPLQAAHGRRATRGDLSALPDVVQTVLTGPLGRLKHAASVACCGKATFALVVVVLALAANKQTSGDQDHWPP